MSRLQMRVLFQDRTGRTACIIYKTMTPSEQYIHRYVKAFTEVADIAHDLPLDQRRDMVIEIAAETVAFQ
ncbi:MAG: hypothetical protein PHF83_02215 [Candidatus Methanomethylophilus sp.]|nr:hypothetical protein [Methanomethylophilus sp.]